MFYKTVLCRPFFAFLLIVFAFSVVQKAQAERVKWITVGIDAGECSQDSVSASSAGGAAAIQCGAWNTAKSCQGANEQYTGCGVHHVNNGVAYLSGTKTVNGGSPVQINGSLQAGVKSVIPDEPKPPVPQDQKPPDKEPEPTPPGEPAEPPAVPPNGSQPTSCSPVIIARGEKFYTFTEATIGGGKFPLAVVRRYHTDVRHDHDPNGYWDFTYISNRLNVNSQVVTLSDGGIVNFTGNPSSSNGGDTLTWTSSLGGIYYKLVQNKYGAGHTDDEWELTRPDNTVEMYFGGEAANQPNGWLKQVTSATGLVHSFSYVYATSSDYPTQITITDEQTNAKLRWNLNSVGYPTTLLDVTNSGSPVTLRTYTWDSDDRLDVVSYPGNFQQKFDYNNTKNSGFKRLVTGILEIDNNTSPATTTQYSNVVYDSLGRATKSELLADDGTTGLLTTNFSYNWNWSDTGTSFVPTTTTSQTNGPSAVYSYSTNSLGIRNTRSWQMTSRVGSATGCESATTSQSFNSSRFIVGMKNARGFSTKFDRTGDSKSRVVAREDFLDENEDPLPQSQRVETTWLTGTDKNLPDEKRVFGWDDVEDEWDQYRSTAFTYDGNGRITERTVTPVTGTARTWTYDNTYVDSTTKLESVEIDGPSTTGTTTQTYNSAGQLDSVVPPSGYGISYNDYNAFGKPETITDANGIVTETTYDASTGRLTGITQDVGGIAAETTFTYYPSGLLKQTTRPDGGTLEYFYNHAHQLIGIENNLGEYIEYTRSAVSGEWVTQDICTAGNAEDGCTGTVVASYKRTFDAFGRLSVIKNAAGNDKQILGYDTNNNVTSRILLRDATSATDPTYDDDDIATVYSYDPRDNLASVTGRFACDGACPLENNNYDDTLPSSPLTEYTYDNRGNIKTVTDANENATNYSYNDFDQLTEQESPDSGITTYVYNAAGLLSLKTDANDVDTKYQYDSSNRLTAKYFGDDPGDEDQDVLYTYDQYDSAHGYGKNRLTRVTDSSGVTDYKYDALGRVTLKSFDPVGALGALETAYSYNDAGALLQVTHFDGRVVNYDRSTNGIYIDEMNVTVNGNTADFLAVDAYQPFGGITGYSRVLENSNTFATTRVTTLDGLVESIANAYSGGGSLDFDYGYDAFNNIESISNSSQPDFPQHYQYDAQLRLKQALGIYGRYTYEYDAVGNRQSQMLERNTVAAPTTFNEIFTETYDYVDNTNKLESVLRKDANDVTLRNRTFSQDANGNRTKDKKIIYVPGTSTVQSNQVMVPGYGNNNRMDGINATDCVANPSATECQ